MQWFWTFIFWYRSGPEVQGPLMVASFWDQRIAGSVWKPPKINSPCLGTITLWAISNGPSIALGLWKNSVRLKIEAKSAQGHVSVAYYTCPQKNMRNMNHFSPRISIELAKIYSISIMSHFLAGISNAIQQLCHRSWNVDPSKATPDGSA